MAGVRTRASKRRIDVEDTSRDARSKKRRIEAEDAPRDAKGKSKAKRKLDFGEGAERAACAPTSLPREIAEMVLWKLDATDLASLAAVDRGCRSLAANEHMWQLHVEHKWGAASALMKRAAALAGGWQQLYAAKSASDAYGGDWTIPSHFETEALLDELVEPAVTGDCDCLDVVFLLDGSGSVSHDDFVAMTGFVQGAARVLTGTRGTGGGGRSGGSGGADRPLVCPVQTAIVQFSNDTQVELELGPHDFDTIQEATVAMERMSGGTNIAQPLMLAQTMMEDESRHPASLAPSRAVVLLTDGRVDSYSARQSVERAQTMAGSLKGLRLYTLGVGRGVDCSHMLELVAAGDAAGACAGPSSQHRSSNPYQDAMQPCWSRKKELEEHKSMLMKTCRYLALRTLDDVHW